MIRVSLLVIMTLAAASCLSINCVAQDDPCSVVVPGQVFCDDFSDGSIRDDQPVSWYSLWGTRQLQVVDDSLVMSADESAFATISGPTPDVVFSDTSIRSQVHLSGSDWIGVTARWNESMDKSYSGFLSATHASIGVGGAGAHVLEETPVDFDVTEEDIMVQLDVFDDTIRFWAWPADDEMPSRPTLTAEGQSVPTGKIFLWAGNDVGGPMEPVEGVFRFAHVATTPIPEPSTAVLSALGLACLAACRRKKSSAI